MIGMIGVIGVIGVIVLIAPPMGVAAMVDADSVAQQTGSYGSPITDDALEKLQQASEQVRDLTATFEQIRHTPLLRQPLESRGSIHVNEKAMIWETREPHRSTMSISDDELRLYYPDDALLEIYPLSAAYAGMNVTPLLRPRELREHFDIRSVERDGADESLLTLHLSPRQADLQDRLASIVLEVARESALVRRGEMTTPDGERTEFRFTGVQVNTGPQIKDVTRNVPEGTHVVRPASDVQGRGDAGE
jgi:outer membrane lipoprotein-sorting protein